MNVNKFVDLITSMGKGILMGIGIGCALLGLFHILTAKDLILVHLSLLFLALLVSFYLSTQVKNSCSIGKYNKLFNLDKIQLAFAPSSLILAN
jgi:hypothetical protein